MSAEKFCRIVPANPEIGELGNIHIWNDAGPGELRPFVLGIHGGGWSRGDQKSFDYLWPKLQPLGIAVALVSYRKSGTAPFPAAMDDLIAALAWLKEHGASHGLDVSRCVVFGSSAGGHLAMLLTARAAAEDLPRPVLRGVAQYCGIMDLPAQYEWDAARGTTMTSSFLGGPLEANRGLYEQASPVTHVTTAMPPVWMAHGTADNVVPYAQSLAMVERLREINHDVIFLEARGLGHTMVEIHGKGGAVEPLELLFERDLLRFFQRCFKDEGAMS